MQTDNAPPPHPYPSPSTAFPLLSALGRWNDFYMSRMAVWFACAGLQREKRRRGTDWRGGLSCTVESRGQNSMKTWKGETSLNPYIAAKETYFFHLKQKNTTHHPCSIPSFSHSRMCFCVSLWITHKYPADRQLSKLTFSEQGEEHSEISIRLPSFHCVCFPPSVVCPPSHAANWDHLVFR